MTHEDDACACGVRYDEHDDPDAIKRCQERLPTTNPELVANVRKLLDMAGAKHVDWRKYGAFTIATTIGTSMQGNANDIDTLAKVDMLLRKIGSVGKCRHCNERIYWVKSKRGKNMPIQADALSHFAECPGADDFRRRVR